MIDLSSKTTKPHFTSVETNLKALRPKWRKQFTFEHNQIHCINKSIVDERVIEAYEDFSKSLVLHKRKNYNTFSLCFLSCIHVTEESIRLVLRRILPEIKDIKEFKLRIHQYCVPRRKGFQDIFQETLRNLPKLESLTIDFQWFPPTAVTDEVALGFLAKEIGNNQDQLKHLKLEFNHCTHFSSESFQVLGREIGRKLCKLQTFILNFGWGVPLSNEALESICYGIGKYQIKLKKFGFDLTRASSLDDEGLKRIANAITKRFDQLEWLSLNFSMCPNITNSGLELLSQKIATLPKLVFLRLGFQECEKTTFKIRDTLRQNLRHIPQMRFVF